jgi:hypothetical protein
VAAPVVEENVEFIVNTGSGGTVNSMIALAAGNLGVAGVANFSGAGGSETDLTISDSVDGAWTVIARVHAGGGTAVNVGMFYKANTTGGTVNVTWASNSGGITLFIYEVSGAVTVTPLIGSNSNTVLAGTLFDSLNVDNTGKDDALYAATMCNDIAGNPVTLNINQTGTEGTWVRFGAASDELNGTDNMVGQILYQAVTTGSSRGHVWGTTSANGSMVIAAFEGVAGTPQFARPTSDSSVGTWTTDLGGTTNLYATIDEVSVDDADYMQSVAGP